MPSPEFLIFKLNLDEESELLELEELLEDELDEPVSALAIAAVGCSALLSVVLLALFKLSQSQKPACAVPADKKTAKKRRKKNR